MRRSPAAAVLLVLWEAAAHAQPVVTLRSVVDVPGSLAVYGRLASGGLDVSGGVVAGSPADAWLLLRCPWLAAGPLDRNGLLREALDPPAWAPWSGVAGEQTALVAAADGSGADRGVLVEAEGTAGLLGVGLLAAGPSVAAWGSLPLGDGLRLDAALEGGAPPREGPDAGWYHARPAWAGGPLLGAAARLVVEAGGADLSTAFGVSAAARAAPGAWLRCASHLRAGALEAWAGAAACTPSWTGAGGRAPGCLVSAGARLGLAGARGGLDVGLFLRVGRPGFLPGTVLPQSLAIDLALSRVLVEGRSSSLSLSVRAARDEEVDADGRARDAASVRGELCAEAGILSGAASAGWNRGEGAWVEADARLGARAGRDGRAVDVEVSLRLEALETGRPSSRLAAGISARPAAGQSADAEATWKPGGGGAGGLSVRLSWTVRSGG